MIDMTDTELREAGQRLRDAAGTLDVELPSTPLFLDDHSSGPRRRGRHQGIWIAAAAAAIVALVGLGLVLRDDSAATLTAGDPQLTPEQIVAGFVGALEAHDPVTAVDWAEGGKVGWFLEPNGFETDPRGLEVVAPLPASELEQFRRVLALDRPEYTGLSCVPHEGARVGDGEQAVTCSMTLTTDFSRLTAIDGSWEIVWDVRTAAGRIVELLPRPHDVQHELDGLSAYRHWADRLPTELSDEEFAELVDAASPRLVEIERDALEAYPAHLRQQQLDAFDLAAQVCGDLTDGADVDRRLELAWGQARVPPEPLAPVAVAKAIEARCPGAAAF